MSRRNEGGAKRQSDDLPCERPCQIRIGRRTNTHTAKWASAVRPTPFRPRRTGIVLVAVSPDFNLPHAPRLVCRRAAITPVEGARAPRAQSIGRECRDGRKGRARLQPGAGPPGTCLHLPRSAWWTIFRRRTGSAPPTPLEGPASVVPVRQMRRRAFRAAEAPRAPSQA